MKKDNKPFANCRFFLLGSFLLTSCNISSVSSEFKNILTGADYWISEENTALGTITYKQTFDTDGTYTIKMCYDYDTDANTDDIEYNYSVGYYNPKYAFILYREEDLGDIYYIVGTPVYFYFENDLLVTSSNSNMSYPRKWTGVPPTQ